MQTLLKNIHVGLGAPGPADQVSVVEGDYEYWHYCCDGCEDRGWGCGYRTLQTLCSWIRLQRSPNSEHVASTPDDKATTKYCGRQDRNSNNAATDFGITVLECGEESVDHADVSACDSGSGNDNHLGLAVISSTKSGDSVDDEAVITVVSGGNVVKFNSHQDHERCDTSPQLPSSKTAESTGVSASISPLPVKVKEVPSLREIQQALVDMDDKPNSFVGSRQWIGSYEVCICLDYFYDVPCRIVHINQGSELNHHLNTLFSHFSTFGSPVMMGGDSDASSKGIMGVCLDPPALLVVDPHYSGTTVKSSTLRAGGWVKWILAKDFHQSSFYNLCLPQPSAL